MSREFEDDTAAVESEGFEVQEVLGKHMKKIFEGLDQCLALVPNPIDEGVPVDTLPEIKAIKSALLSLFPSDKTHVTSEELAHLCDRLAWIQVKINEQVVLEEVRLHNLQALHVMLQTFVRERVGCVKQLQTRKEGGRNPGFAAESHLFRPKTRRGGERRSSVSNGADAYCEDEPVNVPRK